MRKEVGEDSHMVHSDNLGQALIAQKPSLLGGKEVYYHDVWSKHRSKSTWCAFIVHLQAGLTHYYILVPSLAVGGYVLNVACVR